MEIFIEQDVNSAVIVRPLGTARRRLTIIEPDRPRRERERNTIGNAHIGSQTQGTPTTPSRPQNYNGARRPCPSSRSRPHQRKRNPSARGSPPRALSHGGILPKLPTKRSARDGHKLTQRQAGRGK